MLTADGSGLLLPRFLVLGVLALLAAELLQLQPVGAARLLLGAVVPRLALLALQPDVFAHRSVVLGVLPWGRFAIGHRRPRLTFTSTEGEEADCKSAPRNQSGQ